MVRRLSHDFPGFATSLAARVETRRAFDEDVSASVGEVIEAVRRRGDEALRVYTARWDRHDPDETGWRVGQDKLEQALDELDPDLRATLELAARRITAYYEGHRPPDSETVDAAGVRLGARWRPSESAGIYVPGGRATYPSSVLMNALPARAVIRRRRSATMSRVRTTFSRPVAGRASPRVCRCSTSCSQRASSSSTPTPCARSGERPSAWRGWKDCQPTPSPFRAA